MFDLNGDGKLGLSEMSRYVPALNLVSYATIPNAQQWERSGPL